MTIEELLKGIENIFWDTPLVTKTKISSDLLRCDDALWQIKDLISKYREEHDGTNCA